MKNSSNVFEGTSDDSNPSTELKRSLSMPKFNNKKNKKDKSSNISFSKASTVDDLLEKLKKKQMNTS